MTRPCKLCGKELHFMEGPNGKMLPYERATELYVQNYVLNKPIAVRADPSEPVFQSHFDRCLKKEEKGK